MESIHQSIILERLPFAEGAAFDSSSEESNPVCLENTRVQLLAHIYKWAQNDQDKCIYWLSGMAGTGKSTISRTIAQNFHQVDHLGASFFFKRGEGDRGHANALFTTLAGDLAARRPLVAAHIKDALDADMTIVRRGLREQFDKLILKPIEAMAAVGGSKLTTTIMVIDALDECEPDDVAKTIVQLFSRAKRTGIKVFITSRPELPVRLGFGTIADTYVDFILHKIPEEIVESDISLYLEHELDKTRVEHNNSVSEGRWLPEDWPGKRNQKKLVRMACPLFIFAATISRFVRDRRLGSPDSQLQHMLRFRTNNPDKQLQAAYMPVLHRLIDGLGSQQRDQVLHQFRNIIGSIVILASPLSTPKLALILKVSEEVIYSQLDALPSVLDLPDSSERPVRLFHLSFRDFLLNPDMCNDEITKGFWVDATKTHAKISKCCLEVLEKHLEYDICGTYNAGISRAEIPKQQISHCLPQEVAYSCLYWVDHLKDANTKLCNGDEFETFLQRHFLHWIEALSVLGRARQAIRHIKDLKTLVLSSPTSSGWLDFLDEADSFLWENIDTIDLAPLQTYFLLAFAPKSSKLLAVCGNQIPTSILTPPLTRDAWDLHVQIIDVDANSKRTVSFSSDGSLAASVCRGKIIEIWDINNGERVMTLESDDEPIKKIKLSPDSSLLVSVMENGKWFIWDTVQGECIHTLPVHEVSHQFLEISFDSSWIVTSTSDNDAALAVWNTSTGTPQHILKGHTDKIVSISFAAQSMTVASGSDDCTVRIWDVSSGKCLYIIDRSGVSFETSIEVSISADARWVSNSGQDSKTELWNEETGSFSRVDSLDEQWCSPGILFAPNSQLMAIVTAYCLKIYSLPTLQRIHLFEDEEKVRPFIYAVFSPDSRLVACAASKGCIYIWDVENGAMINMLQVHDRDIHWLAFSPSNSTLASSSGDRTIRLWKFNTVSSGRRQTQLEAEKESVRSLTVSPNLNMVASTSTGLIRIWTIDTGSCACSLSDKELLSHEAVFSPNSELVLTFASDYIFAWRVATGELLYKHAGQGFSGPVAPPIAFSADSRLFVTCPEESQVQLRSSNTAEMVRFLEGGPWETGSIVFSPDGNMVGSASVSYGARLWCSVTGRIIHTLECDDDNFGFESLTFSHDQSFIALVTENNIIQLWRTDTGQCVSVLGQDMAGRSRMVALSSQLNLAAFALDNEVRLWNVDARRCGGTIKLSKPLESLEFSDNGTSLVTDLGILNLKSLDDLNKYPSTPREMHIDECLAGCGLTSEGKWILWNGKKFLWLSAQFRPSAHRIIESTVVIGCSADRVVFIKLKPRSFPQTKKRGWDIYSKTLGQRS